MANVKVLTLIHRIVSDVNGKDKITRLLQYFCKFLAAVIKNKLITSKTQRDRFTAAALVLTRLYDSMSVFRKTLRFGKELQFALSVVDRYTRLQVIKTEMEKTLQQCHTDAEKNFHWVFFKALTDIFSFFSCFTDHFLYVYKVKLVPRNKKLLEQIDLWNEKLVLASLTASTLANFIQIGTINAKLQVDLAQSTSGEEKGALEKAAKEKKKAIYIDLVRMLFDVPENIYFFEFSWHGPGLAGFCSTISSCISFYQLWKSEEKALAASAKAGAK